MADKSAKIDKLRAEGRLCAGPTSSREGCTKRATYKVLEEVWPQWLGVGKSTVRYLPMCTRHAAAMPSGYLGVNFRVIEAVKF